MRCIGSNSYRFGRNSLRQRWLSPTSCQLQNKSHNVIRNNNYNIINPPIAIQHRSQSGGNVCARRYLNGFCTGRRGGVEGTSTLILLRHGESEWNGPNARFSGWCDVPLTVRGRVEAVAAGQLMRSRGFKAKTVCVAFASELQRSHETCELALASMAGQEQNTWSSSRIRKEWKLNERHYGAVQGILKNDEDLKAQYGEDTLRYWRRSMHGKAPPMDETHEHYRPPPAPLTESLKDCQKRVVECWEETISPALFEEENLPIPPQDRTIMVVAHSNTLRSLMAHFDNVPDDQVQDLYVPNSVPILYRFETETREPISVKLESGYGDSHARWMLSAENHHAVRNAIKKGGSLTRALFDAMDIRTEGQLTGEELEIGLRELRKDTGAEPIDCVVMSVATEISRHLGPNDVLKYSEFEKLTKEAYDSLTLKHLNPGDKIVSEEMGVY